MDLDDFQLAGRLAAAGVAPGHRPDVPGIPAADPHPSRIPSVVAGHPSQAKHAGQALQLTRSQSAYTHPGPGAAQTRVAHIGPFEPARAAEVAALVHGAILAAWDKPDATRPSGLRQSTCVIAQTIL